MLRELADMPAGIRALEATGTLTSADYARIFAPMVEQAGRTGGRLRLLYEFAPGFQRITGGALWADARLGTGYLRLLDGCAVVSDSGWVRTTSRAIGSWMPCPLRVYHNDERDDAVAWLASLPECPGVSGRDMAKAYVGGVGAALVTLGGLAVSKRAEAPE
ncbi:hypothetical protein A5646_26310 [Mycobacterium sp. 1245499.0]|nr:hypothetical protein A5646_26310 [Mycobacterium sp. 1245499.0]